MWRTFIKLFFSLTDIQKIKNFENKEYNKLNLRKIGTSTFGLTYR